jgi:hypothetical protein
MGIIRTFKCKFNDRVTTDNRDGVIQSLINQFEGLGAEPEVTLDGDTFSLTLNLSDNLTPTMVRDKLSWNYFIDRVTTGDSIRKIKVMRMPKSVKEVIGDGQGQLDGIASDTGVNEILLEDGRPQAQPEYKIDMGDRPDGPPVRRRTPAVFGLGMSRGGSKFAHHADLSHPVPGSAEELLDHMENHHPDEVASLVAKANSIDPGQTWSKMKENFFRKFNNQGRPQDVFDDLSDDHLFKVHSDGKEAGDHPHKHGNDLNIDIPDTVPQEISTPKELTVTSSWIKKSHDDTHPWPITNNEAVEHIISHHPELVDDVARGYGRSREEVIDALRTGDLKPAGGLQGIHKSHLHENNHFGSPDHSHEELVVNIPDTFTPTASSWVKQADPGSLRNEGQAFTHEPDNVMGPEDLDSMATDVTKLPKIFATENSAGGSQFGQPFDRKTVMDSVNRAPQESRGPRVTVFNSGSSPTRATGGPIPFNSWYSEVGSESIMPAAEDKKAPLDFTASLKGEKASSENIDSAIELPEATQGGTVLGLEGWFSASLHFGYDDGDSDDDGTYDYSEDNDKDED